LNRIKDWYKNLFSYHTRPKIVYAVIVVSQFMHDSGERYTQLGDKILVLEVKPRKGIPVQAKRYFDPKDIN